MSNSDRYLRFELIYELPNIGGSILFATLCSRVILDALITALCNQFGLKRENFKIVDCYESDD